ncbi:hypothetical protein FNH22_22365 [Fulvivirga sp. M361]|uniref:hypothetical protein n=1 Tax=Fulvivirga sp. M361 TaxID=2594266 RepID=UPI00117AEC32|nr:hypothetical protein [Fulvivirga sp. M361]TRX52455.1 hypothetical protein FNH22_22365 [Fulvivirga sp. M361]
MKKTLLHSLLVLVVFTSCDPESDEANLNSDLDVTAVNEAEIDAVYEDIDDLSIVNFESVTDAMNGRVAEEEDDRLCDNVVSFEGDRNEGTITIDFGEGCVDPNGNVRKGKIVIEYNGPKFQPESEIVTTLIDYSINDIAIEGVRTLENISTSTEDFPTFHILLEGGKVTWPDETFATREVDRVRVWKRARNPREDAHLVTGTANGMTRRGIQYDMEILDTLVYKRACLPSRRARIPVAGVKQIETENKVITIDFGDGECDRRFDVSIEGITEEVTVD